MEAERHFRRESACLISRWSCLSAAPWFPPLVPGVPPRTLKTVMEGTSKGRMGLATSWATSSGDRKPRSVRAWPAPGSERARPAGHLPEGHLSTQERPSGPHGRGPGCVAGIPQGHGPGSGGGHPGQSIFCFSLCLGGKYEEALLIV